MVSSSDINKENAVRHVSGGETRGNVSSSSFSKNIGDIDISTKYNFCLQVFPMNGVRRINFNCWKISYRRLKTTEVQTIFQFIGFTCIFKFAVKNVRMFTPTDSFKFSN